jgi:hypothetical protein
MVKVILLTSGRSSKDGPHTWPLGGLPEGLPYQILSRIVPIIVARSSATSTVIR